MCRLLCVAARGIIPHPAMKEFKRLARHGKSAPGEKPGHRSAWGMGYFPGGKLRLVREFGDASMSVRYDEMSHMAASNPDARVLLGHLCSLPPRELLDHREKLTPVPREDAGGRVWLLSYDGDIGERREGGGPFTPDLLAETAAERLLREIMARMPPSKGDAGNRRAAIESLSAVLRETAAAYDYERLNLALTDGHTVYLARFVEKEAGWNEMHFCRLQRAVLGCSEPLLTVEPKWEPLGNRQLLVFDGSLETEKIDI